MPPGSRRSCYNILVHYIFPFKTHFVLRHSAGSRLLRLLVVATVRATLLPHTRSRGYTTRLPPTYRIYTALRCVFALLVLRGCCTARLPVTPTPRFATPPPVPVFTAILDWNVYVPYPHLVRGWIHTLWIGLPLPFPLFDYDYRRDAAWRRTWHKIMTRR